MRPTADESPTLEVYHSPGLEAALRVVRAGGGDRVLDLGPAVSANLEFLSSSARHLRVADLLSDHQERDEADAAGRGLLVDPAWGPFDLVLAWDVLSYLEPEGAAEVVASITEACSPGACLFALVTITKEATDRSVVFVVRDGTTLEYRPAPARQRHLRSAKPAAVQRLLAPFRVERSFVLRNGFQEYVAVLE